MRRLVLYACVFLLISVAESKKGKGRPKLRDCNKQGCNKKLQLVCGSDGVTYNNLCLFNKAKCEAAKNGSMLALKSSGPCRNITVDAKAKNCSALIDCITVNTTKHSICGSDNVTYPTFCFFRIARCLANQNKGGVLTMKYKGICGKPKNPQLCPLESQCDNSRGKAICGSDGKTYRNTCLFLVAKCQAKKDNKKLKHMHKGACGSPATPKPCPKNCPSNDRPVCGTDGKTYQNGCHLAAAKCALPRKDKRKLSVKYNGRCDAPSTPKPCLTLQKCKQTKKPVCGTDGNTYPNMCRLRVAKCHAKRNKHKPIEMKHKGKCKRGGKKGKKNNRKGRKGKKSGRKGRKNRREE